FTAICRGELSTWAASRVLVPLARANNDQAQTLLTALQRDPLSTRELHTWYQHYQKANHRKRERMLAQPRLFCQALQAQTQDQAASELRAGPEGVWLAELKRLTSRLRGLHKQLPLVFTGVLETAPLEQESQKSQRGQTRLNLDSQMDGCITCLNCGESKCG
ncbi:MAG: hypothetical protein GY703_01270, partial [Gammaproteobacteria bacterium]|nr:hypothetical protein [Gammaproteobacteria bacterium]